MNQNVCQMCVAEVKIRVYFWKTLVGATGFEPVTSSL